VKIAIVTDSTSDIPPDVAVQNDIQIVPAILILDGRSLEDGHGITREELYRQLPGMKTSPTTAAPSSGTFYNLYDSLLKNGVDDILSIHLSSILSGIYNAAATAAKSFGNRVHVIDSLHVSLGLGYQVLAAARAASAGLPINEILKVIEEIRTRIHLIAMLDTLEYAHRSGRISWSRSSLTSLLQIKPFLGVENGKVIRMGETRTRKKGIDRLFQMLFQLGKLEDLAVLHSNAEVDASQFAERAYALVRKTPLIVNVTSIIGVHVGPDGLGFVAVTR
jgi:DegV family protein with EDD domain